ncbi:MAG: sigma-54 dependent transcriptional regulator [Saprospiraceae bacterium]
MNLQTIKNRFGIIGRSEKLDRALSTAVRVSNTDLTVLITGESGVGKEVFSKIIHKLSVRKHNEFIAINTGAIPGGTINSELFGHEKGAFTGATSERKGYFETVNGGTIFLDEIGEMPLDTQSYLLRVLETGEFIRVGSSKVMKTDVRIIAATNVDLEKKIHVGKFREDLFYRLNTVPIRVPSLSERREDIYMLFRKFAVDFSEKYKAEAIQLDQEARQLIENYRWPGNVRELKNIVEQLSILLEEKLLSTNDILDVLPKLRQTNHPRKVDEDGQDSFKERELLYKVLFDMKNDLNDMKGLIYELVEGNDLKMPKTGSLRPMRLPSHYEIDQTDQYTNTPPSAAKDEHHGRNYSADQPYRGYNNQNPPVIVNDHQYQDLEVVEENLSLEYMEKEFIQKALKRHNGKRKEAAQELGISERTLYRKINFYEI